MKDSLDSAMTILNKYHEIAQDIIEKYELYNTKFKNHRILKSIDNLNISNKNITDVLNKISYEKDIKIKINTLLDIYHGDRNIYNEGLANLNNNNENIDFSLINENLDEQTQQNAYKCASTEEKIDKKKKDGLKSRSRKNINDNKNK